MKKPHLLLVIGIVVVAIVTICLLLLKGPEQIPEPNCDAQYSQLSVSEFSSCADAIESVEAFLSKFSKDEKFLSRCEQARKMEDEFVEMKSFLDKDFSYLQ